jgi:hypothetical protein
MSDEERLPVLTGLLDFFSDRAGAHASFVVATVFGIYTLLFAHDKLPLWVFFLAFFTLQVFAVYSFLNFGYFATRADIIRERLEDCACMQAEIRDILDKRLEEKSSRLYYPFRWFKHVLGGWKKYLFLMLTWSLATILPFFSILATRWTWSIWDLGAVVSAIVIAVYLIAILLEAVRLKNNYRTAHRVRTRLRYE